MDFDPRNMRMEETSKRQRTWTSSMGGQGTERVVAPQMEYGFLYQLVLYGIPAWEHGDKKIYEALFMH